MSIALHLPLLVENSETYVGETSSWGYMMANPEGHADGFGDSLHPGVGDGVSGDAKGSGSGDPYLMEPLFRSYTF